MTPIKRYAKLTGQRRTHYCTGCCNYTTVYETQVIEDGRVKETLWNCDTVTNPRFPQMNCKDLYMRLVNDPPKLSIRDF